MVTTPGVITMIYREMIRHFTSAILVSQYKAALKAYRARLYAMQSAWPSRRRIAGHTRRCAMPEYNAE